MRIPPSLKPGDRVGICSPARKITPEEMAPALASLQAWGLEPVLAPHVYAVRDQYAGTDAERLGDLQAMLDATDIQAILFSRGGYGCLRIVDGLDWRQFLRHPKWLIGFSDITTFTMAAYLKGVATIHGPMCVSWNGKTGDAASIEHLHQLIFGNLSTYIHAPADADALRTGKGTGRLVGGNLSMLSQLLGTATDFETNGCILFLEDVDEYLYHIDRMMVHLRRAGKLAKLAGLVIGGFSDIKDNETPFGKSVAEIVHDAVRDTDYPICFDFPTGHWPRNYPLVHGAMATLSVSHSMVELKMELR
jgi:muramoyltetrapeptide carboxypeptidase